MKTITENLFYVAFVFGCAVVVASMIWGPQFRKILFRRYQKLLQRDLRVGVMVTDVSGEITHEARLLERNLLKNAKKLEGMQALHISGYSNVLLSIIRGISSCSAMTIANCASLDAIAVFLLVPPSKLAKSSEWLATIHFVYPQSRFTFSEGRHSFNEEDFPSGDECDTPLDKEFFDKLVTISAEAARQLVMKSKSLEKEIKALNNA